jgi:membrane protease YdiL (CAAX protease family)
LASQSGQWKSFTEGFAWGFASLAVVALIAFAAGGRDWNGNVTIAHLLKAFFGALLTAIVVATLEELLFRGALLGSLCRAHPWPVALLLSSALYALVHFFQRPQSPADITWLSGFVILGRMLAGFVDPHLLVPGFLTLIVAGAILGLALLRTGNLYQSIGLHTGWIFWLKFYGLIAIETPAAREHALFWGTAKLFDGWLAFIILLPVFLIFWRNYTRFNEGSLDTRTEKLA